MASEDHRQAAEEARGEMGALALATMDCMDGDFMEMTEQLICAVHLMDVRLGEAGIPSHNRRGYLVGVLLGALDPDD